MQDMYPFLMTERRKEIDLSGDEISVEANFECPQDRHIAEAEQYKMAKIKIVGCGGGGSNTVTGITNAGVAGADVLSINTDSMHLLTKTRSKYKLLIGKRTTRGNGTGGLPRKGEESAMEEITKIREFLRGSDLTFITCGLGGGTGTGSAPVVAKAAKESGSMVISIVTLPFKSEGKFRTESALHGLDRLYKLSDTTIAIPNDKVAELAGTRKIEEAFSYADSVLTGTIGGITDLIVQTGLVNIDFADVVNMMRLGGAAVVGVGHGSGENKALNAMMEAIRFPLLEADLSEAKGCIVSMVGGRDLTIKEGNEALSEIKARLHPDARLRWGLRIDPKLDGQAKTMVLLVGVKSPYSVRSPDDVKRIEKLLIGDDYSLDMDMIS